MTSEPDESSPGLHRRRPDPLAVVAVLVATALGFVQGCSEDRGLEPEEVAGDYTATRWIFMNDTVVLNVIPRGGSIHLTLQADGTTSGTAVLPPATTSVDSAVRSSLAGRWRLKGDTVELSELEDTVFLSTGSLRYERVPRRLRGEFYGIRVILEPED